MQIHVTLIPISSTDQPPPGPDPPEKIFHYTTGLKLQQIINSGYIRPSTAHVPPHETPVAWFSTQDHWEPTATKVPVPGMAGQILTAKSQGGLVRVTVPEACAPYVFPQLPLIAGSKPSVCIGLLIAGLAWCVSGRGCGPPSDTPRGLFPNSLMSTGTKTGRGQRRPPCGGGQRTAGK